MGDYENLGHISTEFTAKGQATPSDSKINFPAPHFNVPRAKIEKSSCSFEESDILTENIEFLGQFRCNKSTKICTNDKNT